MTPTEAMKLVATREVTERARDKSFLVSTAITLAVIIGVIVLQAVTDNPDRYEVGYVGNELRAAAEGIQIGARTTGATAEIMSYPDQNAARAALEDGEVEAVLMPSGELFVEESAPGQLELLATEAYRNVQVQQNLQDQGLSNSQIAQALNPPPLRTRALNPPDPNEEQNAGVAFIGVLLLYGQLFAYGYWVAAGIIEEKSSRVVEILLSTIRPSQLLAGKIIGIGLLGFVQLLTIAIVSVAAAVIGGVIELPATAIGAMGAVLFWFVLGYGLYSCLFAVSGAVVSRMEELQSSTAPLSVLVFASLFGAIAALQNPDGALAKIISLLPPSAPLTMPTRMIVGEAAAWEVVLSIVLMLASIAGLVRIAARLYEGAVLRTGGQVKLREAWAAGS